MAHLIDLFLHLDVHLTQVVGTLGGWFYGLLFLILFCETGLVVTPFLPGDSLLFAVGALAAAAGSTLRMPLLALLLPVAAIVGQLVTMRFSRTDESQADDLGVQLMAQAGYDPHSMINVMEILQKEAGGGRQPEFFSTHPNPAHRIEQIQADIQKDFPNGLPDGLEK